METRTAKPMDIMTNIHVLWERGWKVTPEAVQEMVQYGGHISCPIDRIEQAIASIQSEDKERWLAGFNWESDFAKQHPRPWPIDPELKHQQQE